MVRNGRLFLTADALDILAPELEKLGELLPVTYGENKGFIFNILSIAEDFDGVDKKLSSKNEFGEVQSFYFHESKLQNQSLFKTVFDGYLGIYCNENLKNFIENNRLRDVTFSNDTGSIYRPNSKRYAVIKELKKQLLIVFKTYTKQHLIK